jgi:hypothetical protein
MHRSLYKIILWATYEVGGVHLSFLLLLEAHLTDLVGCPISLLGIIPQAHDLDSPTLNTNFVGHLSQNVLLCQSKVSLGNHMAQNYPSDISILNVFAFIFIPNPIRAKVTF